MAKTKKPPTEAELRAQAEAEAALAAQDIEARRAELDELLTLVELGNHDGARDALIVTLTTEHGAELDDTGLTLAGVTVANAPTVARTLADWAMEARRAMMALG
jgi:hypothetical protein